MYMHIEYLETKTLRVRKKVNTADSLRNLLFNLLIQKKKQRLNLSAFVKLLFNCNASFINFT